MEGSSCGNLSSACQGTCAGPTREGGLCVDRCPLRHRLPHAFLTTTGSCAGGRQQGQSRRGLGQRGACPASLLCAEPQSSGRQPSWADPARPLPSDTTGGLRQGRWQEGSLIQPTPFCRLWAPALRNGHRTAGPGEQRSAAGTARAGEGGACSQLGNLADSRPFQGLCLPALLLSHRTSCDVRVWKQHNAQLPPHIVLWRRKTRCCIPDSQLGE